MSKVYPISYTNPPQSVHKISDSALQRVQLNASITGYEPRKQFAICLTVEQIVYRKAASAIEKRNQQKKSTKKTKHIYGKAGAK